MKHLIVFWLAIAGAFAENILRVKWGIPQLQSDVLFEVPREVATAAAEGWVVSPRPPGALPGLALRCPFGDLTVCAFYDDTGFIAGLQIALSTVDFNPSTDLSAAGFTKWVTPTTAYTATAEYWINQQFFVSKETLRRSPSERRRLRSANTLQEGAVWVPDVDGEPLRISTSQAEIHESIYTEQACIPTMGLHYYHNMSESTDCSSLYPWFTLVDSGELIGTGFVVLGTFTEPSADRRMWFERPTEDEVRMIVPRGPECLYDLAANPGTITLHIYYDQDPTTIGC